MRLSCTLELAHRHYRATEPKLLLVSGQTVQGACLLENAPALVTHLPCDTNTVDVTRLERLGLVGHSVPWSYAVSHPRRNRVLDGGYMGGAYRPEIAFGSRG